MKKVSKIGNQILIGHPSDNRMDIGQRFPIKMRVNLSIGRGVGLVYIPTHRPMIDGDWKMKKLKEFQYREKSFTKERKT